MLLVDFSDGWIAELLSHPEASDPGVARGKPTIIARKVSCD
jgi:hypothetical protein